jgi:hypothetical protein
VPSGASCTYIPRVREEAGGAGLRPEFTVRPLASGGLLCYYMYNPSIPELVVSTDSYLEGKYTIQAHGNFAPLYLIRKMSPYIIRIIMLIHKRLLN